MAKALNNIPMVEPFLVNEGIGTNLDKKWEIWKEDFRIFILASGITQAEQKKALLLHIAGRDVKEIYRTLKEETDDLEAVILKLDTYFKPKKNLTFEKYNFKKAIQKSNEDSAAYITRLRSLAATCEFADKDMEVKDQFIASCKSESLRKKLLREAEVSLTKLIEICRCEETAKLQSKQMNVKEVEQNIDEQTAKITGKPKYFSHKTRNYKQKSDSSNKINKQLCFKCGDKYFQGHMKECKANGKACYCCGGKNHLSIVCRNKSKDKNRNKTYFVDSESESESGDELSDENVNSFSIKANSTRSKSMKYMSVKIENVLSQMLIDTGSSSDIIDKNTFEKIKQKNPKLKLKQTNKRLYPYASKPIPIVGYFDTVMETHDRFTDSKVFVVNQSTCGNLLSLQSAVALKLVDMNKSVDVNQVKDHEENVQEDVKKLKIKYDDIFKGRGKLKHYTAKLYVKPNAVPVYQKMRRHPYHIREAIRKEIYRLEKEGVIEKVNGPQEWASNLVVTPKKNGDVRLCLDARLVNTVIEREKHPIPTLESIVDDMNGSIYFSKLDMKEAYNQIELAEQSRYLTNFHTDEGLMRYTRLCYGINNAFEQFQKGLDQNIGKIKNVKFISDDLIIYTKTIKEHTKTLEKVFSKIKELNLRLNKEKCVFIKRKLSFFGIVLSEEGVTPDPEKIDSLQKAASPKNESELQSFLGLCTYMSKFIENFSEKTAPLRKLLRKENKFTWTKQQEDAFQLLKNEITSDSVLGFYDPSKSVELITDASDYALGGILVQEGKDGLMRPITYISRSLTERECKYSVTEKEALALVWAIEKLHMYLYSNHFTAVVDHQPLQFIFKPTSKLNARIARWQLKLQNYEFTIRYQKGSMNIADFVSRIRKDDNNKYAEDAEIYVNFITKNSIPICMSLAEIQSCSENDEVISAIKKALFTNRWDDPLVKIYSKFKYELCESNSIILKENKIVLPKSLHEKAIEIVHRGHLGVAKSKSLLREKVYWHGLDNDVESKLKNCVACKANGMLPAPQPIKMSELPKAVWSEIAIDFCGPTPTGEKLLVVIDLYSRFPIVEAMNVTSEFPVISRLQNIFSIYGYPDRCRHDNGPPFNSYQFNEYLKSVNIENNSTTPYYPQSNAVVENINKILNKAMKAAKYENKNWRSVLTEMLLNYRCSPHSTTGRSPAEVFFNRTIKNGIPLLNREISKFDAEIRTNQERKYEKATVNFDKKRKSKKSSLKVDDMVIMKRSIKGVKSDSKFYNHVFTVIKVHGSTVTVQKKSGEKYTRNISFFKTVKEIPLSQVPPDTIQTQKPRDHRIETSERKTYPKRNRKTVYKEHLK